MRKITNALLFLLILSGNLFAQTSDGVDMADAMRSNGKIFVVVGVIAIVFTGIIIYLVSIDKKISRLEKKVVENSTVEKRN